MDIYSEGHTADPSMGRFPIPLWAKHINWENRGLWLVLDQHDLTQALPNLKIHNMKGPSPHFVLEGPPATVYDEISVIQRLELKGINLAAYSTDLQVCCHGATLSSLHGSFTTMRGMFELVFTPKGSSTVMSLELPKTLYVVEKPGWSYFADRSDVVTSFRCRAKLTGEYASLDDMTHEAFDGAWSVSANNPDFVFLNEHGRLPDGSAKKRNSSTRKTLRETTQKMFRNPFGA